MAQRFVKDRLKSPGTADFGSVWGGDYQAPRDHVEVVGVNTYVVKGWVDAENAFGGTMRCDFRCKLQDEGNGEWRCLEIDVEQRE